MATADDSYIAWDGRHYPGSPPAGWYLAVDNRWWPPQDVIDDSDVDAGPVAATPAPDLDTTMARPTDPVPDRSQSPISESRSDQGLDSAFGQGMDGNGPDPDWAPDPAGRATRGDRTAPPSGPRRPPSGGPPTRTGPGRSRPSKGQRRRPKPGLLIAFLIFGLFRCTSGAFDGSDDVVIDAFDDTDTELADEGFDLGLETTQPTVRLEDLTMEEGLDDVEALDDIEPLTVGFDDLDLVVSAGCLDDGLATFVTPGPNATGTHRISFTVSSLSDGADQVTELVHEVTIPDDADPDFFISKTLPLAADEGSCFLEQIELADP